MASFLAFPTNLVAVLPGSSNANSGNVTACFSKSFCIDRFPKFTGLQRVPNFSLSGAAKSHVPATGSRRLKTTVTCSAATETLKIVQDANAKQLGIEVARVTHESKLSELGSDSLDTAEIMMALEERLSVSVGEDGAEKIGTVQDAADLIEKFKIASSA